MNEKERHVMEHSLGWPKNYRNHFCASKGHDDWETLQALCERGLMKIGRGRTQQQRHRQPFQWR